jgi:hypothetical protein
MKLMTALIKKLALAGVVAFLGLTTVAQPAIAGTNLTVTCPAVGLCNVVSANTPLIDEGGWIPGSSVTQYFRMSNVSTQNGFAAVEVYNYSETKNLGEVIDITIRRGSPVGPIIYTGVNLHDFRDDGYFTIDSLNAGQTTDYFVTATMRNTAGNQYQAANVIFNLRMGLEITPIPPTSGGGNGSGSPGGGGGGSASPPVCTANPPSSAPNVTITNVGTNTVTLSWTPVDPVTHYALIFTRTSDGAQYGSPNVGNVTSYTITNLSGTASYTFQVFGVNDCAPGPRSGNATSGIVPGAVLAGRPTGPGGQVLGVTTEATPTPTPSPTATPSVLGVVAGEAIEACSQWRLYIPWILLVIQALIVLWVEYYFRRSHKSTKHFFTIGTTLLSILIFYLIRECDCYGKWSWLAWLCQWYWLVSTILTVLLRAFSYAFIEDAESLKETKAKTETKNAESSKSAPDTDEEKDSE